MIQPTSPDAPEQAVQVNLDPVSLVLHASGPVFVVFWMLVLASVLVWLIAIMKLLQVTRMAASEREFEDATIPVTNASDLFVVAKKHTAAPGARVVLELAKRAGSSKLLGSVAKRALVSEQQRASSLMSVLGSIASASPFIGLFGTVYGIMDAFIRIGAAKTASLPVVAPAIGEALITTAIGLAAAIPAVFFYNWIDTRVGDFVAELEAAASEWVALVAENQQRMPVDSAIPLVGGGRAAPLRR